MSDGYRELPRCKFDSEVGDPVIHTADYFEVISEESHTVRAEHKFVDIF
jgi:hypothetical protein